ELLAWLHGRKAAGGSEPGTGRAGFGVRDSSPPCPAGTSHAGAGLDHAGATAQRPRRSADEQGGPAGTLADGARGGQRTTGDAGARSAMELPGAADRPSRSRGIESAASAFVHRRVRRAASAGGRGKASVSGLRGPARSGGGAGVAADVGAAGGERAGSGFAIPSRAQPHAGGEVSPGGIAGS